MYYFSGWKKWEKTDKLQFERILKHSFATQKNLRKQKEKKANQKNKKQKVYLISLIKRSWNELLRHIEMKRKKIPFRR